ncbi:MAG: YecA family protein [Gammaproteobacteria bacterium]|nr:YecA family protein [Gammaproteobacteria bacterium]MCW8841513.1 YecA family protein [Gammaproteobacteria bacterium]MCW8928454.1 YecA family protein [Gammaproteobacteria bacterium]MCW8957422.1 YecA family protein [Gammaproteobacteria bacterium]MCW8973666.1 YecA family protein [Gammaproteobacteria bacterium]
MSSQPDTPLTQDELTELDDFLLSGACDDETLSIDEAHGYLTALQLPPVKRDETEWLKGIWGAPQFADEREQQRMSALLRQLSDDIAAELVRRRDFEPLVIEMEEGGETVESYEGWCYGFMLGVEQQQALWQELPKTEQGLLAPMAQLALLEADDEDEMEEDEYMQWVELIPGAVMGLYAFWHSG